MTAALEMQRTRPTRIKVAGIQTYPLTWVPTGHARALPLRPSRQRTPGIQTYPPGGTSPALPQPEGPAGPNPGSGYENAASLVFLPCFSPADSQNRLAASEGRDVLGENKRILPPILSRGVAFPSQMWQFGQTESNAFTRALFSQRRASRGRTHDKMCQTGLYRGCLPQTRGLSPGCMASTIFRHRWRAPGGKTQWRGALREGNASPQNR